MLKINWFSPLPPQASGIAQNFCRQVLPALTVRHETILWTDQDSVSPQVERLARVAHFDPANPPWRALNEADICIYHLGNHGGFHGGIWRISRQHAGIVVLHDLCLHDFFNVVFLRGLKKPDEYLAALERWYGAEGRRAGEAFQTGGISAENMGRRFPLTREAAHGALGIVTHSPHTLAELNEKLVCPVAGLDHPFAPAAESVYRAWLAARNRTPGPPYRLVVFGYLSTNRRLESLLEALSRMPERGQFHLHICGELWDETHIRAEIERLKLEPLVSLHGFLPDAQVEEQLSAAHLAINLRFPSMGEASGSQLQFFNYGLPTLVTRTGWYRTLPEDTVRFVRPDHEIDDIQTQLRALLADPAAFRGMGECGRQLVKNYAPETYVEALIHFASTCLDQTAHVAALRLAGKIGCDLFQWLHPAGSEHLLEQASSGIATMFEHTPSCAASSKTSL